jgi:ribosomal protein S12 methylthiotransferase
MTQRKPAFVSRTRKTSKRAPRVGFVSLGCPKALVDSEQILTRLRAEGYEIAPEYGKSDLVIVNTCGFIDDAVAESLDAIGEALEENGKVIVTGCLGARSDASGGNMVAKVHPKVPGRMPPARSWTMSTGTSRARTIPSPTSCPTPASS